MIARLAPTPCARQRRALRTVPGFRRDSRPRRRSRVPVTPTSGESASGSERAVATRRSAATRPTDARQERGHRQPDHLPVPVERSSRTSTRDRRRRRSDEPRVRRPRTAATSGTSSVATSKCQADDPELVERLDVERVCVAHHLCARTSSYQTVSNVPAPVPTTGRLRPRSHATAIVSSRPLPENVKSRSFSDDPDDAGASKRSRISLTRSGRPPRHQQRPRKHGDRAGTEDNGRRAPNGRAAGTACALDVQSKRARAETRTRTTTSQASRWPALATAISVPLSVVKAS